MKERIQKIQDLAVGGAEFAKIPENDHLSEYIGDIHEENISRSIYNEQVYSLLEESRKERSIAELELSPPTDGMVLITRELLYDALKEFAELLEIGDLRDEVRECIEEEVREVRSLLDRHQSIAA